ncbi:4-hydroxyphenylacetate 3-hydroxylase [Cytobacillus kochii]|uniref:4-hydroxyphenylacetate 3-hydroxylase family protein n=1 Tax=Cytobacillus kochii TaxID=859143 RepID=UPI001CD3A91E|nr:4-hydroxyphenylacetate 3-hydroxylase N-terminal domain-containing protein [Cytobacillus kochii]MCA1028616.1 4-hydroxyphenylacetate 3-hydroxylase [Cytobacillus kochii]
MFKNSLKDGRSVWLNGRQVDITQDPHFVGTLQTIESLFYMLENDQEQKEIGYFDKEYQCWIHKSFLIPRSKDDLIERRKTFQLWTKETDGMMSRLSDYARSRLTGWYANREFYRQYDQEFPEKISSYFHKARKENRFISVVQRDLQIDRSIKSIGDKEKLGLLSITKKTDEGVFVSGAKMIGTAAPYSHDLIIYPLSTIKEENKSLAHMLIVAADSPGLHMVCREPFSADKEKEEDYPLSSKFDEMDTVLIFDNVFVPWERVLLHENTKAIAEIKVDLISNSLAYHQSIIRLYTKLDFVAAIANEIAETIGAEGFLHVQEKLGELIIQLRTISAMIIAAEQNGKYLNNVYIPEFDYIQTARILGTKYYPRAIEIIQLIGSGGFIQIPSSVNDFDSSIGTLLQKYFHGKNTSALERTKLFKLAWDLIGSPFGSRHELYERFYSGDPILQTADQWKRYDKKHWKEYLASYLNRE